MREIKFRVWSVLATRMINWENIFHLPAWEIFLGTPEQRPFNVMQYTGLKDKNGKEIYEGDIIKNTYGTQIPMVVTWDDDCSGFRTLGKYDGEQYVGYVKDSCEVIGNIYKNPELLKDNK